MEKTKGNQKEIIHKILQRIKKYWFFVFLSILFAAVTVILTLYVPILIGDAINKIVTKGAVDFKVLGSIII